jgi:hypothetical protein
MADKIKVNRAPVMTLWAAVVAQQLGFDPDEALTLGKAVAGMNAQSKGQRLGIYDREMTDEARKARRESQPEEQYTVGLLGRAIPVVNTKYGVRAMNDGRPEDPGSVQHYLEKKFGEDLPEVRSVMEDLARSIPAEELKHRAYGLYEEFRPEIPEGTRGWGAEGELDLDKIRELKE